MRVSLRAAAVLCAAGLLCACAVPRAGVPAGAPSATGLTVIAHGVGSSPDQWPLALEGQIRSEVNPQRWDVVRVDWTAITERPLTSAARGYRLGYAMGQELASRAHQPAVIHLVAHSMGAHLIQGFADAYHPLRPQTLIHLTFLDAFMSRGPLTLFYGIRVFGRNSTFAESYVTRGEPAFLTNALLRNAFNFDISGIIPESRADNRNYPHNWPVDYYLQSADHAGPGVSLAPHRFLAVRSEPESRAARSTPAAVDFTSLVARYRELGQRFPRGSTLVMTRD